MSDATLKTNNPGEVEAGAVDAAYFKNAGPDVPSKPIQISSCNSWTPAAGSLPIMTGDTPTVCDLDHIQV